MGAYNSAFSKNGSGTGAKQGSPLPRPVFTGRPPLSNALERKGKESRVLVVDDDAPMCGLMREIISDAGFKSVTSFTSPLDALEAFKKEPFDILITDFSMPLMNGDELIRRIRSCEGGAEVRVMVASGTPGLSVPSADALLKKPFMLDAFLDAVERLSHGKDFKKASILLVDDDETTCRLIRDNLNRAGYQNVSYFTNPHLALDSFKKIPADVVVTDYDMRQPMDGIGLIEGIRGARPGIPFKAILHSGEELDAGKLSESGIVFVRKGEGHSSLKDAIEGALRAHFKE